MEFKRITSITKVKQKSTVVNFSVEKNENYFANGILTHNCYMKRHLPVGLTIATNHMDILEAIGAHRSKLGRKVPNQTHARYWTYDISCNEDFSLHLKYHKWGEIFDWFEGSGDIMASFATKHCNEELLKYRPKGHIRIRMSMMPEIYREQLEPNTSTILERMQFINELKSVGYDVHINFSPVIVTPGALEEYLRLFERLAYVVDNRYKPDVLAEVIFLTHNRAKHEYNLEQGKPGEELIWRPEIQRTKRSQYGGENLRYEPRLKAQLVREFRMAHDRVIPWNTIRYIF